MDPGFPAEHVDQTRQTSRRCRGNLGVGVSDQPAVGGQLNIAPPETSPRGAATATLAVAGASVAADLTMIGLVAVAPTTSALLAIAAVTTSVTRIACSAAVLHQATRMSRRR